MARCRLSRWCRCVLFSSGKQRMYCTRIPPRLDEGWGRYAHEVFVDGKRWLRPWEIPTTTTSASTSGEWVTSKSDIILTHDRTTVVHDEFRVRISDNTEAPHVVTRSASESEQATESRDHQNVYSPQNTWEQFVPSTGDTPPGVAHSSSATDTLGELNTAKNHAHESSPPDPRLWSTFLDKFMFTKSENPSSLPSFRTDHESKQRVEYSTATDNNQFLTKSPPVFESVSPPVSDTVEMSSESQSVSTQHSGKVVSSIPEYTKVDSTVESPPASESKTVSDTVSFTIENDQQGESSPNAETSPVTNSNLPMSTNIHDVTTSHTDGDYDEYPIEEYEDVFEYTTLDPISTPDYVQHLPPTYQPTLLSMSTNPGFQTSTPQIVRSEPASEAGAGGSYAMLGVSIGACALVLVLLLFLVILYMGYKKWQSAKQFDWMRQAQIDLERGLSDSGSSLDMDQDRFSQGLRKSQKHKGPNRCGSADARYPGHHPPPASQFQGVRRFERYSEDDIVLNVPGRDPHKKSITSIFPRKRKNTWATWGRSRSVGDEPVEIDLGDMSPSRTSLFQDSASTSISMITHANESAETVFIEQGAAAGATAAAVNDNFPPLMTFTPTPPIRGRSAGCREPARLALVTEVDVEEPQARQAHMSFHYEPVPSSETRVVNASDASVLGTQGSVQTGPPQATSTPHVSQTTAKPDDHVQPSSTARKSNIPVMSMNLRSRDSMNLRSHDKKKK